MRILVLQLKRIGDLILTTPVLRALRLAWPEAHLALGVQAGCAPLLGAVEGISAGTVFGPGRGFAPWQQVLTGPWDLCLDFTGTDRSALATALSRGTERLTFEWVRKNRVRALAYRTFVESSVRERHTVDHYLDLLQPLWKAMPAPEAPAEPVLKVPDSARAAAEEILRLRGISGPFALLHPGSARSEKYWVPERWAEVARSLRDRHGLAAIVTSGPDAFERAHAGKIEAACGAPVLLPDDLLMLAALVERARVVVSCDTAVVHLAAAFRTPQVALFGPTNPFHWRPRHSGAVVISAARPEAPLTEFQPKMKGGPMERISTEVVIRATEGLLALPR